MKRYGCLGLLCLLAASAHAQLGRQPVNTLVVYRPVPGEVPLRDHLYHFADSTGRLTIRQVSERQRAGQFRASASLTNRQDFGYNTTATHWLFFELTAPKNAPQPIRLMLEIEYANLDELELIEVSNGRAGPDRVQSLGQTGDRFQFSQRPYRNNSYVFPIRLGAGQTSRYFLRLKQPQAVLSFAVRLWHRPAFLATDRTEYGLWGIYIGIICMVLVLNLVMLFTLRDRIYIWYSLYLHFMTMHLFTDAGLSFQYLWPTFPRVNEFMPVYLYVWAAMVTQTTFMQYFIRQNRRNSRVFRWVNGLKWVVTVALAAAITVEWLELPGREHYMYQAVSLTTSCLVPVIVVLTIASLAEAGRRRAEEESVTMVRYYGYALAVQLTGYTLVAVMNLCQAQGWPLPFDVETYVVLGLSVLADLVFFTYGLAYRYTHAQRHNQQLELSLFQSQQEAQQQVIRSLENERQRLAQDLHDDIGPLLATAKGYLSRLARTDQTDPLPQALALLDEAADELRTLSHQLLPRQLEQTHLADALAETVRQLARRGIPVQFVTLGRIRSLSRQSEQLLLSVATQLIRTAQKRSCATEVIVQLLYHDDQVTLSVEDDGLPADAAEADASNLRAKADLLKADLLIDTNSTGNSLMMSVVLPDPTPA